ncbi:DUF1697 domain-containing protein [Pseudonocardia pini]|uniref:DUF1697 domain-containing protein n=1 Tax=Pseudonocardia pini TaxID=2758030 RepID=UPI0015F0EAC0|nr:DUF1697 domain-containing protein [Pseudonocardia pini]
MAGYAVLLRGVNVGGNRKVPMAELREILAGLGYTQVRTLLQSGNAVLAADEPAAAVATRLEEALRERYGADIRCLALTREELRAAAEGNPLTGDNGSRMVVMWLFDDAPADAPGPEQLDPDRIAVRGRLVYQWCPEGISNSPDVAAYLRKEWKVAVTARNRNTVEKLIAAVPEG